MITDPDEPGYRMPDTGELLYHEPTMRLVECIAPARYGGPLPSVDEVEVRTVDTHRPMTVKLRSLADFTQED